MALTVFRQPQRGARQAPFKHDRRPQAQPFPPPDGSDCNPDTSLASGRNRRLSREAVALTPGTRRAMANSSSKLTHSPVRSLGTSLFISFVVAVPDRRDPPNQVAHIGQVASRV
jgi:hypothetical protein